MTVAVAVSGGADSLLALALLRESGCDAVALHGLFLEDGHNQGVSSLEAACRRLGADFRLVDLRREFRQAVVEPFIRAYAEGLTPNPCAACNRAVKFGLLLDAALDLGAESLATGHYVRAGRDPEGRNLLQRGRDLSKDQSYFLALVPRERLARAVFPLGEHYKESTVGELAKRGLAPPSPRPSQEICFVPDDDYRAFLENSGAPLPGPGDILLEDGRRIGAHKGLWRYTPGQRRGLGVAWSEPLYVLDKDVRSNALIAGPGDRLSSRSCRAGNVNLLVDSAEWPEELVARTRYRQQPKPADVRFSEGVLDIRFRTDAGLPAPGQLAVVYHEDTVLAGGIITRPGGPAARRR